MDSKWICGLLAALVTGICLGVCAPQMKAEEPVQAVFAPEAEENLFAVEAPASGDGFSIEIIALQTPAPPKRVLIYHTHTYEAYEQTETRYKETEKWRTADNRHNVVRVGEELAALLRSHGLEVVHDTSAFEPPTLSSAYTRSLSMLEKRLAAGEHYDLLIDLHRDAATSAGPGTIRPGGVETARLMMLIGKGEGQTGQGFDQKPDWESNLAIAQKVTDLLNAQADGLCRDVCIKSGRFNQHVAAGCMLIEAGNNKNTLAQVLAAMPYLADAIAQAVTE